MKDQADAALQILRERDGLRSDVALASGRSVQVWNVAWGRDAGDDFDHVTTNISPSPAVPHDVDFVYTSEIAAIVDPSSGTVLYRRDSLQDLSEQGQAIVRRCLEYVLRSGALAGEFETRMGLPERTIEELLKRWPQVGHVGDGSDDSAINQAMNEVVNGIHISETGWREWFPWSRRDVADTYDHWRRLNRGSNNF